MALAIGFGDKIPGSIMGLIFVVLIGLLIFSVIRLQLIQEYDELGWVMLACDYIVVKIGDEEIEYAIDQTTTLSLELRGYAGEPIIGQMFAHKKGYDNFISLTNSDGTGRYEILVSNTMKIDILERLTGHYRSQGVKVNYVDRSSDDSIKSLILRLLLAIRGAS